MKIIKLSNFFTLLMAIFIFGCKQTPQQKLEKAISKHLEPTEKKDNTMKIGETIVFSSSETMGIDRGKYPAPSYYNDIDTNYFNFVNTESISDGAAGGSLYTYNIYKAIKTGKTKIDYFKTTQNYNTIQDYKRKSEEPFTKEKIATYTFTISD